MKKDKKLSHLFLSILVVFALFAAVLPQPAAAAGDDTPTVACQSTYKVQKNDTVLSIAQKFGISVTMLTRANELTRPYDLDTGEKLCIPYKRGSAPVGGKLTFSIKGDKLRITADDFDHGNSFFVKVKATQDASAAFARVGILNVEKNDLKTTTFSLPKSLQSTMQISVCLKHFYTNELTCYYVLRTK